MQLNQKTLEYLRELINEKIKYRSGPKLVEFFNAFGFNDTYCKGFPSRWWYIEDKLKQINNTPNLCKCIRNVFAPINFVGEFDKLDSLIADFNKYISFDGWLVVRQDKEIIFVDSTDSFLKRNVDSKITDSENEFLNKEFEDINLKYLNIDSLLQKIITERIEEIKKCMHSKANLSTIFMCGSVLEGLLLSIMIKYPEKFNQADSAQKDSDNKIKPFPKWKLGESIDTACELGFILEDVKKFSHVLRDFRNYIHPCKQKSSRFQPDEHTAKICFQVLKAAICQISDKVESTRPPLKLLS
ncbi:MAG: hypothetical protein LE169_05180 [Endomicrobium sp.]|nr:hypothetical protein [Endomicrobium sp.]